jgi:cytochrome c biogenesis protein CcmG/thiol:disulfide interchange protein DsbE
MLSSNKIKWLIPFMMLFSLLGLLGYELFAFKPNEIPSALIGETVPAFELQTLTGPNKTFTEKDLIGRVSLLNVWATWCYACGIEHEMLMNIKNKYNVPIYSIAYKDNAADAKKWLADKGNPYVMVGDDSSGDLAIDLGVYGTPETFIISKQGKVVYKHIGVIDQKNWDEVLYPLIQKYEKAEG